jgi:hypothetical protein
VAAENFLQHAEHYQRILIAAMSEQEKSRREAAAQATDDPTDDEQPSSMEVADAPSNGGSRPKAAERNAHGSEIGGMTTIDAGPDPEGLVIAPEEMAKSQPRPDGDGRRSRRRPRRDDGDAGQPTDGQQTAEAAEG